MRVGGIERAATITILVDGDAIAANEGETGIKMTVMGDTDWDNGG